MVRVHTVTPNAAVDEKYNGEQLLGRWPGGKGILCAVAVNRLSDVPVIGHTFLGGETGDFIRQSLNGTVQWQIVPIGEANRRTRVLENGGTCLEGGIVSTDAATKTSTAYPFVPRDAQAHLDDRLRADLRAGDYCAWGGSLPRGFAPSYFADHIAAFPHVRHIVDTSNTTALRLAAEAGAYALWPNKEELDLAFNLAPREIGRMFERYRADVVLLTLGAEGLVLARRGHTPLLATPPCVEMLCTLGAGDYAGGACLAGELAHLPDEEIARQAVAFATDSVRYPGSSAGTRESMRDLLPHVRVTQYLPGTRRSMPHLSTAPRSVAAYA